jgi:predicted enzyme related to lactoylglutathione lyase
MTMADKTNRPVWIDLGSKDPAGSRAFYSQLFGWEVHVSPDPQYGGYGRALLDGKDAAGIGPAMSPEQPTAWTVYIGTSDAAALGDAVTAAGGTVVMPAFDVGDQGRMAVFQDPTGAFISAWQTNTMGGFDASGPGSFGWAELSARGMDRAVPFYQAVFGWGQRASDMPDGTQYIEFMQGADSVAGGMEMSPMVPPQVPSYWMVYFQVADVDAGFAAAVAAGAHEVLAPRDFGGGRFAILNDPQGAMFGLLKTNPRA